MYLIIETIENNHRLVTAVPNNWYIDGKLYWPYEKSSSKIKKLIINKANPQTSWEIYTQVKVLSSGIGRTKVYTMFVHARVF